jgi:uncharacterized protein YceK
MKKTILVLAIALLITAILLSGCGKTEEQKETKIVTSEKSSEENTSAAAPAEMSCTDTDDGNKKETKGAVSGVDVNGKEYNLKDTCYEEQVIVEYFCDGNQYKNQNYFCDCKNGACSE